MSYLIEQGIEGIKNLGDGAYSYTDDVCTDDVETSTGFNDTDPKWMRYMERLEDETIPREVQEDAERHLIHEFARLRHVTAEIDVLSNEFNGFPTVTFKGSFSSIYELLLHMTSSRDEPGARDAIRAALDDKVA